MMKIERVVADTNVLISAALSPLSTPALVVYHVLQHGQFVFSSETFAELETRIWRPKFDRYISIERRHQLLHDFSASALWTTLPLPPRQAYSRDPDDDMFIHTALRGNAHWLVSGDRDLLELSAVPGITIVSPADALALLTPPSGRTPTAAAPKR